MGKLWTPTAHPVLRLPTAEQAVAMGVTEWERRFGRGGQREQLIADERADPMGKGWEPPIWRVCDALLGFPWIPEPEAQAYRERLGFRRPVDVLLINGGQRAAKTTYGLKRMMKVLWQAENRNAWCFHSNRDMSVQWHQAECYRFLPKGLQRKIQTATTYIAFKKQTGFSDDKFILPNGGTCKFRTYEQDEASIEGANLDYIFCDELVPPEVVRTLQLRIAERGGKMVIGFTPVDGYTETVREFQDGATVQMESIAYLCPTDGGPPDVARALGLTAAEYADITDEAVAKKQRVALAPQSVPERCGEWISGQGSGYRSQKTER